jgi:hypothetical protein
LPERVGGLALNVVIVIYLVIRLIRRRARQPLVRADGPGQTGLLRRREADEFSAVLPRSDGAREFGEDHCELRPLVDIQSEFVVAATEVLHKRVPGTDHPCRAEPFHVAHRPQPGLQAPVIGFDGVIRVLLGDVTRGGEQSLSIPNDVFPLCNSPVTDRMLIFSQRHLRVVLAEIRSPLQRSSVLRVRTNLSAKQFARGQCGGIWTSTATSRSRPSPTTADPPRRRPQR